MPLPPDAALYERRVEPAVRVLTGFTERLVEELDVDAGGFNWWSGFSDWKTLTLLSDYLIQLVMGVRESILSASLAATTHSEKVTAEHFALKTKGESYFPLDAVGRQRAMTIRESAHSCFFHLGQALDRAAVAIYIVGGIVVRDAVGLDWTSLEKNSRQILSSSEKNMFEPVGSPGREVQEALLATVLDWEPFGPEDWLPWMRDTRNGMAHRAGGTSVTVSTSDRQFATLFHRHPKWSELQSLAFGGGQGRRSSMLDAYVMSSSPAVLNGLCDSVARFLEQLTNAMTTCWDERQAMPTLIVQHGRQWKAIEPADGGSKFPGYDTVELMKRSNMLIHPSTSRRWQAGRVMDDRRADWQR
ncbi:hypothetical protein [Rhodococcus sp. UNC23MFCrub1.1]|uniref:hypothetical protein n=1 Tax=Rhodococcus sp. UNC23MFCrub1.1 TaxID=1449068 RepID=UPI0012DDEE23|nr:hypothetical protein [Rhodococcus sp. UNC23MFCrub1.1]